MAGSEQIDLAGHDSVQRAIEFLRPKPSPVPLVRIGGSSDGAYLIPDDVEGIEACFSPGVDNRKTFEDDLQELYQMPAHMCDFESDESSFVTALKPGQTFEKKWLSPSASADSISLDEWVQRRAPGHGDLMLQMDIEGAEYVNLLSCSTETLRRFRVIVVELHKLPMLIRPGRESCDAVLLAERLASEFVSVHVHLNNCCGYVTVPGTSVRVPRVLEVTLLRKDRIGVSGQSFQPKLPHFMDIAFNVRRKRPVFLDDSWRGGPPTEPELVKSLEILEIYLDWQDVEDKRTAMAKK